MSNSNLMGGSRAPGYAPGRDVDALGPSDSSDSGSDVQGETQMPTRADNAAEWGSLTVDRDTDSDALGTGERASASGEAAVDGADILPDRVFDPEQEAAGDDELRASADVAELPDDAADDGDDDPEGDVEGDDSDGADVESGRGRVGGRSGSVESVR